MAIVEFNRKRVDIGGDNYTVLSADVVKGVVKSVKVALSKGDKTERNLKVPPAESSALLAKLMLADDGTPMNLWFRELKPGQTALQFTIGDKRTSRTLKGQDFTASYMAVVNEMCDLCGVGADNDVRTAMQSSKAKFLKKNNLVITKVSYEQVERRSAAV